MIHANASSSFFSNVALLDKFVENIRLIIIIDLIIIISEKKDMKSSNHQRNLEEELIAIKLLMIRNGGRGCVGVCVGKRGSYTLSHL